MNIKTLKKALMETEDMQARLIPYDLWVKLRNPTYEEIKTYLFVCEELPKVAQLIRKEIAEVYEANPQARKILH